MKSHINNRMALLTSPGEGALQIFQLSDPDETIRRKILAHFEPRVKKISVLRLGILKDAHGEILDEIFLEDHGNTMIFHLHGGSMSLHRLKSQLEAWGAVDIEPQLPISLEDESLWALEKAMTSEVTQMAMENLKRLPEAEPSVDLITSVAYGESLFNATRFYMVGAPNAGKSSLINRLIQKERLVVDDTRGTTRDLIEVDLLVDHRPIKLIDAAGLRKTDDSIEKKGQDSLKSQMARGNIFWVVNPHEEIVALEGVEPVALVLTHQDQGKGQAIEFDGPVIRTGANDRAEELKYFIESYLPDRCDPPFIFTRRQYDLMEEALCCGELDRERWLGSE